MIWEFVDLTNSSMKIPCTKNVSEIICVETHLGKEFPLNLKFRAKEVNPIKGPCIYLIFHKNSLIYIGSYKPNHNKANLVKDRIWTHIASITMRGHRVTLPKSLHIPEYTDGKYASDFYRNLENITKTKRQKRARLGDKGCKTSKKRVEYAALNWQSFRRDIDGYDWLPLSDFELVTYQLSSVRGITDLEKELIKKYSPFCNYNSLEKKCEMPKEKVIQEITLSIKPLCLRK